MMLPRKDSLLGLLLKKKYIRSIQRCYFSYFSILKRVNLDTLHQTVEDQSSSVAASLWCSLCSWIVMWLDDKHCNERKRWLPYWIFCNVVPLLWCFFDGAITLVVLGFFLLNFQLILSFYIYILSPFVIILFCRAGLTPIMQLLSLSPIWGIFLFLCVHILIYNNVLTYKKCLSLGKEKCT